MIAGNHFSNVDGVVNMTAPADISADQMESDGVRWSPMDPMESTSGELTRFGEFLHIQRRILEPRQGIEWISTVADLADRSQLLEKPLKHSICRTYQWFLLFQCGSWWLLGKHWHFYLHDRVVFVLAVCAARRS
jgi:hypothetical protein